MASSRIRPTASRRRNATVAYSKFKKAVIKKSAGKSKVHTRNTTVTKKGKSTLRCTKIKASRSASRITTKFTKRILNQLLDIIPLNIIQNVSQRINCVTNRSFCNKGKCYPLKDVRELRRKSP